MLTNQYNPVESQEESFLHPEDDSFRHCCSTTHNHDSWWRWIKHWWLPLVHLVYTLGFTLLMLLLLHGRNFSITSSRLDFDNLSMTVRQTDAMTLISAGLVVARLLSTSWQALAAWRIVFILLENTGLSLSDISWIASMQLPSVAVLGFKERQAFNARGSRRTLLLAATVILLLAWPAQFMSPLASGSVSWIPTSVKDTQPTSIPLYVGPRGLFAQPNWNWYQKGDPNVRRGLVKMSAGWTAMGDFTTKPITVGSTTNSTMSLTLPARRISPGLRAYPDGTVVKNATLPVLSIDSLRWIKNRTELPIEIRKAIEVPQSGILNFTEPQSPLLQQSLAGTCSLLRDSFWKPPTTENLPSPTIVNRKMYAAIFVSREFNQNQGSNYDCHQNPSMFNPLPAGLDLINIPWTNNYSDCIAVAELYISAGSTQCQPQDDRTWPVDGCRVTSGVLESTTFKLLPDPLVTEVMAMMPEVQALATALALSNTTMFRGNLEMYMRNTLTQSYQGTWSALANWFPGAPENPQTSIWLPRDFLKAQVSSQRMWAWMAVNAVLVLSGVMLMYLQSKCTGKTVNDPVITAIMLDSSDVIQSDRTGLCSVTDGDSRNSDLKRWVYLDVRKAGEGYKHPKLMVQKVGDDKEQTGLTGGV